MPAALAPISIQTKTNSSNSKKNKQKYEDPLNNWVLKSLSYTNEIGAGVNEIAPKLTFALWIPTFMYLGADIYDKYKNDKNEYSPSGKRGVKRAITQGLTSFILPAGAIILGQKITSPIGKFISDKLSINAKDAVYRHTKDVLDQSIDEHFDDKTKFKELVKNSLENKVRALENSKHTNNLLKKCYRYLTGYFAASDADSKKLSAFAEKNADKIFDIKEKLQNNVADPKIPKRIYKKYNEIKPIMQKLYGDDYTNYALKTALKEYQNSQIVKNKLTKTLGGIVSLVLLINPINYFVEKILMPKYITPGINLIDEKLKESNHLRLHVKKFDDYHKPVANSSNESGKTLKISSVARKFLNHHMPLLVNQEHKHRQ